MSNTASAAILFVFIAVAYGMGFLHGLGTKWIERLLKRKNS